MTSDAERVSKYFELLQHLEGPCCARGNGTAEEDDRLEEEERDAVKGLQNVVEADQDDVNDPVQKPVDWKDDPVQDCKSPDQIYVHLARCMPLMPESVLCRVDRFLAFPPGSLL